MDHPFPLKPLLQDELLPFPLSLENQYNSLMKELVMSKYQKLIQ